MVTETVTQPGRFGIYGGSFIPETLAATVSELKTAYVQVCEDPSFWEELDRLHHTYTGRPTPLTHATQLSTRLGGAQVYLKREDLAHTGAHKINNALGQGLLAKRMGKTRIIAETGAGQHGVATAAVCSMLGLDCVVYMGAEDMERQKPNVFRMRLMGADVQSVNTGSQTLKDAVNEAMRDWVSHPDSYYLLGSALGPHPYPTMVRDFQSVIGREARQQMLDTVGQLPDVVIACVGGGSNAIGIFSGFVDDENVDLRGIEAGGRSNDLGEHAARFNGGKVGVFQGTLSYVLQNDNGQIAGTHSISAGLDYAAVGPEHAQLHDEERAFYTSVTDDEALEGFQILSRWEGIIPALESAHAIADAIRLAPTMQSDQIILINLSGRGDKDIFSVADRLDVVI
ncbi:MAG: tryptophan synthase subunit beta [Chloroflexi bacterium AL-W]|nr:tryptophan synthase subunit beta [Chloroflexi bacterium AL-N1]NOK70647.1 tryptophan synthase subunit beta [Chloroflexi bacterium AL-N10]NOK78466.1 tryptophan synthase subunit beta [Chloroflexi bacterium AL-N5]NOK85550.1 tryptophan synthase subunit beta [Chloroflexi bacterium AL-W]NOK92464.1 tryptophan synthase subunit beta [Chloroflexi bacterium AL-N15]